MESEQPRIQHAQTLVEMNHCVGTARRDAAFSCMEDFANSGLDLTNVDERIKQYCMCVHLINEAMEATKRSSLVNDRQWIWDRPAMHFLTLLSELIHTTLSLARHVYMVDQEAEVLSEPLGEATHELLVTTCRQFITTERAAYRSFMRMLTVGRALLESSTAKHSEHFTADQKRRYDIAYGEFKRHYESEIERGVDLQSELPGLRGSVSFGHYFSGLSDEDDSKTDFP